jgi:tRNA (guanine37-N1)-methyltransferase
MVMMAPPLADCVAAIRRSLSTEDCPAGPVILMSPAGTPLTQGWIETQIADRGQPPATGPAADTTPESAAGSTARPQQYTLVCGRYEGIDQRFIDRYVDLEISLGDFVLSGGEIAALALMDGLVRRLPGVLNDALSSINESFMQSQLDHPHFTRPEVFEGTPVPAVLLSGHHGKIADWRACESKRLTLSRRPDLLESPEPGV